jgi:hypothetical protein
VKASNTIFLFDEPAANLHSRAQLELLESFERLIDDGHKVIYSTHSHYMIDPRWLSGAYIIENRAIDFDDQREYAGLNSKPTDIVAKPYKQFVSEYPDRVSYFQPILEKLGYANPKLIPTKPVVVTEGISDYHAFTVLGREALKRAKFEFVPGLGAGASGPLISLLLSAGREFAILLDDDKAGHKEADGYRTKWLLDPEVVVTLGDVDNSFTGKTLESLISDETHKAICAHFGKNGQRASKKEVVIYFAEKSFSKKQAKEWSTETLKAVNRLVHFFDTKF